MSAVLVELQCSLCRLRWLTGFFIFGLVVSGATAIPLEWELDTLTRWLGIKPGDTSSLAVWLLRVGGALHETNAAHPFLAYGTDWLAFGHFVIALAFVWAWRDPVRNRWLFDFGLIACAGVVPWALIFGALRGIPFGWRLIDCSFGVLGAIPLWFCKKMSAELALCPDTARPLQW